MDQFLGWSKLLEYGLYARGIIITLYAIVLFRTNSNAIYGEHSPLDFIIYIILGAILGEAIVNNIPLIPSMIVCLLIVIIHRFLAYLSYKNHKFGKYIKGQKVILINRGKYIEKNMRCCRLTANDVLQSLRIQHSMNSIKSIKRATLERGGQISFIFN
jgi:uncharacterized membrane protein YcaP (DUF421 family)